MRPGRAARGLAPVLSLRASCAPRLLAAFALLQVAGASGCATGESAPRPELEAVWSDYAALPDHRALAIAGQLRRNQWVAGASGGHATRAEAEGDALRECARRRSAQRIVDPCRLYVVGDEVVDGRAAGTRGR